MVHFLLALPLFVATSLDQAIIDAAARSSLDPRLVRAVIQVESNFKTKATSRKGAMGLMQVMPETADDCEVLAPYHAVSNLMGACDCLRRLLNRYQGNLELALAAYNAGPSNVEKYRGIPPFAETRSYVKRVLAIYARLKNSCLSGCLETAPKDCGLTCESRNPAPH